MGLGERLMMNIKGITGVILVLGALGGIAIIGMVVLAAIHDGDLTTGVISNLQAIAVGAIGVLGPLVTHYIMANQQTTQAALPPTANVPVTVTATAQAPAATGNEASNGAAT